MPFPDDNNDIMAFSSLSDFVVSVNRIDIAIALYRHGIDIDFNLLLQHASWKSYVATLIQEIPGTLNPENEIISPTSSEPMTTLLQYACKLGNLVQVDYLLAQGAELSGYQHPLCH